MIKYNRYITQSLRSILLIILFQISLCASSRSPEGNLTQSSHTINEQKISPAKRDQSLGSLNSVGIGILVVLTSILGSFFLRDQLDEIA